MRYGMDNDVRNYMNIMRGNLTTSKIRNDKTIINEKTIIRNMLSKVRTYQNENFNNNINKTTPITQKREEEKFLNNFKEDDVSSEFQDLEIYDNNIFWGGTTTTNNGSLDWIYKVGNDENNSGFIQNNNSEFDITIPNNKLILNKLKNYYSEFYKYWRDSELQDKNI